MNTEQYTIVKKYNSEKSSTCDFIKLKYKIVQKFLFYVLKTSDVLDVLVPILYYLTESRNDPGKFLKMIYTYILLKLLLNEHFVSLIFFKQPPPG